MKTTTLSIYTLFIGALALLFSCGQDGENHVVVGKNEPDLPTHPFGGTAVLGTQNTTIDNDNGTTPTDGGDNQQANFDTQQELRNLEALRELVEEANVAEAADGDLPDDYDDDDYDLDDGDFDDSNNDEEEDEDFNVNDNLPQGRNRVKYVADPTSPLGKYLTRICMQVASGDLQGAVASRMQIIPPEFDPVSRDGCKENNWYAQGKCNVHVFLPFTQYQNLCKLESVECIHCHNVGTLQSKVQ